MNTYVQAIITFLWKDKAQILAMIAAILAYPALKLTPQLQDAILTIVGSLLAWAAADGLGRNYVAGKAVEGTVPEGSVPAAPAVVIQNTTAPAAVPAVPSASSITKTFKSATGAVILIMAMLLFAGCVGQQARSHVLIPDIQLAWQGVKEDAARGPAVPAMLSDFDSVIVSGDQAKIAVATKGEWPEIMADAESNLAASPLSAGVQKIRLERIQNFDAALHALNQ